MVVLTKEKPMPSKGKRVIFGVIAIALIVTALVVGLRDGSDTQATPVQKTTENGAPPVETDSEATQAPPGKTPVEPKGHFESYWATYSVVCLCGLLVLVPRVRGWTSGVKRATVGVGKSGLGLVNQHTHGVPFWPRLFTLIGILLAIGVAVTFRIPSSEATKPVEAATAQTTPVDVPPAENVGEGAATDQQAVQPAEQVATPLATPQASGEIPNSLGKVVWQWIAAQHWLTKVLGILLALGIAWALCTHKAGGERWRVIALRFVVALVVLAVLVTFAASGYRRAQDVVTGQLVGNTPGVEPAQSHEIVHEYTALPGQWVEPKFMAGYKARIVKLDVPLFVEINHETPYLSEVGKDYKIKGIVNSLRITSAGTGPAKFKMIYWK